jgi:DNA repair protein RadC
MTDSDAKTIHRACQILERTLVEQPVFQSPGNVKNYCRLNLTGHPDEHFACLFLTSQHRLISFETLFKGTIDGASVYPRVVVRRALELNAAAVIFTHNHPSGIAEPSEADKRITQRLKDALALIDVRVLDHIIVSTGETTSLAERGIL